MNIVFNFKNFEPSDHLRKYARDRFQKLVKYIGDRGDTELQVNLEVEKYRHIAEVILLGKDIHLSAQEESNDMYATVDLVWDKLEAQMRKIRDKSKERRKNAPVRMDVLRLEQSEGNARTVVESSDHFDPKPMTVSEAALQLETTEDTFLVFLNAETERINVVYRRNSGGFGLIDPGI
ncbi:ribose ABC transporter permease [Thermodesulfomicrobium sp. WS]|uniref:ribosome hibernation-promoting factor, HPF/YfiA family n=1 Tax=Thermodesulfomicrobium sp. WS TaxID=3004129 RepID=UPI00249328F3|nr:ribosome-associated translation inhibitor RaiA [Thermodesulfomicrobium sp. WS]BDV01464.1 ribose ABC transporter permease [Thermodesulfomicrobium sp. WS]